MNKVKTFSVNLKKGATKCYDKSAFERESITMYMAHYKLNFIE